MPGRVLTLQDLFLNLSGSINTNSDTSAQFQIIDSLVSDPETLLLNVSGSPPTITVSTNYPVLTAGDYPTSYWRLAEAAATGTAYDSTPNTYSIYPRISSASITAVTQGAASFYTAGAAAQLTSATTSAISFTNAASLQITTDLTLECWVNATSFGTNGTNLMLIGKGTTSNGEYELHILSNGSTGTVNFRQNNGFTTLSATSNLSTSTWYHVAVVRSSVANTTTIYINGVAAGSTTYTVATTTTNAVVIGAQSGLSTILGSVTEVALYHKALSATQIAAHHSWGVASTVTATPYGGAGALYGTFPYPVASPPTADAYGGAASTYGTFVWQ